VNFILEQRCWFLYILILDNLQVDSYTISIDRWLESAKFSFLNVFGLFRLNYKVVSEPMTEPDATITKKKHQPGKQYEPARNSVKLQCKR
jgi:hypothetical protein